MSAVGARSRWWKYLAAWLVMLLVSIANGALREFLYNPRLDELSAHHLASVTEILLRGLVIQVFTARVPPASGREALAVGLVWAALTVAFEFLFLHFVGGYPWPALRANYDLSAGRVWGFVVLWIAVAPYGFFSVRRRQRPGEP